MNTKTKGDITELKIATKLVELNEQVLFPYGDNSRYDLVVDRGDGFVKIQCKTGRLRKGVIIFNTCSQHCRNHMRKDYCGEIDFFGVYCPQNGKCYLIPVKNVGIRVGCLRISPPKNNQRKKINFAEKYKL